jgi:hypothetical protein
MLDGIGVRPERQRGFIPLFCLKPLPDRVIKSHVTSRLSISLLGPGHHQSSVRGRRWRCVLLRLMHHQVRTPFWLWLMVALVIGFLWTGIGLTLWHDHSAAYNGAEKESANLARSFDESIARTVEAVDQTLLFVRDGHQQGRTAFDVRGWARGRSFFNDLHVQVALVSRNGGNLVQPRSRRS